MGKFVTVDLQAADGATKRVVRSYLGLKYHAQNYERLMAQVRPLGISGRVVGGAVSLWLQHQKQSQCTATPRLMAELLVAMRRRPHCCRKYYLIGLYLGRMRH